jgi:toxin YoeB
MLKRIRTLVESLLQSPFAGIGKPEPLKYNLAGKWSRRITESDRLVYEVKEELIIIYSLRGHYL